MKKEESLVSSIKFIRDTYRVLGRSKDDADLEAMLQNIWEDDLGKFDDSVSMDYELDEVTRDRLIAHARYDAAHAAIQASRAFREAKMARIYSWFALVLLLVLLIIVVAIQFW